mmetsp:Transcript_31178/g.73899  ORF Transcript_31178/g.73899 Transcript_31178/m.73899 type:complete len:107 (+) Transcript_31178:1589-1909(+)
MFYRQVIFPVIGKTFIKRSIFFSGNFFWFSCPNRFIFIDKLPFVSNFFDFFCFFIFCSFWIFFFFFGRFFIRNFYFFFYFFFDPKIDWILDEFRVSFYQIFYSSFF